jgi:hypothetical protein
MRKHQQLFAQHKRWINKKWSKYYEIKVEQLLKEEEYERSVA